MIQTPTGRCAGLIRTSAHRTAAVAALLCLLLTPGLAAAADAAAGKSLFVMNCSSCHGMTGKGDGPVAAALNPKPRDFGEGAFMFDTDEDGVKGSDADLKNVVTNGAAAYGGSPLMAGWPTLSGAEIDDIVAYIRTLKQ
jgi:mono/diheme cytochrome c family protein